MIFVGWVLLLSQASAVSVTIDATASKPISPYIYGANHPDWSKIGPLFTLARQGGNRMTAYNWETNASNAGSDWQHQNDGYVGESNEPGWSVRTFFQAAQEHGAAAIVTVPTAGYVSADKNGDGDVNKTPNYLQVRFHRSFAKKPTPIAFPPNPGDKAVYQDEFVAWVEKTKSPRTSVMYSLDNEPDLWSHTHARIVPKKPGYAEIIANNTEFAAAIKQVAPKAIVLGPANYGWHGFRTFQDAPDRNGRDFLDVYLAAMKAAEAKAGRRLLDVLDIHWYPEAQGDGKRIALTGGPESVGVFTARIQAPRSLWDPNYVEKSWITESSTAGKPIELLPRVLKQIAAHYPGTKLAITEYNYGGGRHVSGLLAQADVLGIFGRYGLFAACNWGVGPEDSAMLAGYRAFRNFDAKGGAFGDLGLGVSGERPAEFSIYASQDSKAKGRLTVVAINKTDALQNLDLGFRGYRPSKGQGWVFSDQSFAKATPKAVIVENGRAKFGLPKLSVATLEFESD